MAWQEGLAHCTVFSHPDAVPEGWWYICFRNGEEQAGWLESLEVRLARDNRTLIGALFRWLAVFCFALFCVCIHDRVLCPTSYNRAMNSE